MSKVKTDFTNVKGKPLRGLEHPFRWPFSYEYTRAAMILAQLTFDDIIKAIATRTGVSITRVQLSNYFHGKHSIPPKTFRVLVDLFKDYLNFNLTEVGNAE